MQSTNHRHQSTDTAVTAPAGRETPLCEVAPLTRRAAAGDQQAWSELIERYSRLLWSIAYHHRLGPTDAYDVFQTTWLRLVEHIGRIEDPERVGAWLAMTARRECLRVLRGAASELPAGEDPPDVVAPASERESGLVSAERETELWEAFSRLRPRDQALLRMLVADPAPSYDEVAARLGMAVGSIGPTRGALPAAAA